MVTASMKSVLSVVVVPTNVIVWLPAVAVKLFVVKVTKLPDDGVKEPITVVSYFTSNDWVPPPFVRLAAWKLTV